MDEDKPKRKQKKKETAGERKPNWKEYMATVEDIQNFLMDRILLWHYVITGRVEYRALDSMTPSGGDRGLNGGMFCACSDPPLGSAALLCKEPPNLGGLWQPINDRIVNSLWAELSATKVVRVQDMYRVIESDFVPEFHPFRFYLEHLPPWDGQNHILAMSVSVSVKGDVEEQMLFAEYLTKWLVGMVAGWVDDSVVNNVILVLIGEQGSYKTTWFNYLLPPELSNYFYTKTNAQRMGRDDLLTLAQYGLVCCEELDTMRPSELNQLKAAVTMPSIDEQRIVERQNQHFRIESDEEQLIRSRLRPPHADEKITLMNAASIAQYINGGVVGRGISTRKISLAMPKLGFNRIHTKQGGFYEVYQIPPNEIQATLAMVDEEQLESKQEAAWQESSLPF
jgi:hypothetical protein